MAKREVKQQKEKGNLSEAILDGIFFSMIGAFVCIGSFILVYLLFLPLYINIYWLLLLCLCFSGTETLSVGMMLMRYYIIEQAWKSSQNKKKK